MSQSYLEKKLELKCSNMTRKEDKFKTIICNITQKKCVCCSCANPAIGFVVNPWYMDCPGYKEIIK